MPKIQVSFFTQINTFHFQRHCVFFLLTMKKKQQILGEKWKYINWTISFWIVDSNWHFWALVEVHSWRWPSGKESTSNPRDTGFIPRGEDPLKKEMATQSSILAWEIPWRGACSPPSYSVHGDSPGKNTGVGCHALLQGIFPTQGLNPGILHCRGILYHLSHQGSPFQCIIH